MNLKEFVSYIIQYSEDKNTSVLSIIELYKKQIKSDVLSAFDISKPLIEKHPDLFKKSPSFLSFLFALCDVDNFLKTDNDLSIYGSSKIINNTDNLDQIKKLQEKNNDLEKQLKDLQYKNNNNSNYTNEKATEDLNKCLEKLDDLKKQLEKEKNNFKDEVEKLNINNEDLKKETNKLKEQITTLNTDNNSLENEKQTLIKENEKLNTEITQFQRTLSTDQKVALDEYQKEKTKLQDKIDQLEKELKEIKDTNHKKLEQSTSNIEKLEEKNKELEIKLKKCQEEQETTLQENELIKKKNQQSTNDLKTEYEKLQNKYTKLNSEYDTLKTEYEKLKKDYGNLNDNCEKLKNKVENLNDKWETSEEKVKNIKLEKESLEKQLRNLNDDKEYLNKQFEDEKRKLTSNIHDIKEKKKEIEEELKTKHKEEKVKLKEKIESLEQKLTDQEKQIAVFNKENSLALSNKSKKLEEWVSNYSIDTTLFMDYIDNIVRNLNQFAMQSSEFGYTYRASRIRQPIPQASVTLEQLLNAFPGIHSQYTRMMNWFQQHNQQALQNFNSNYTLPNAETLLRLTDRDQNIEKNETKNVNNIIPLHDKNTVSANNNNISSIIPFNPEANQSVDINYILRLLEQCSSHDLTYQNKNTDYYVAIINEIKQKMEQNKSSISKLQQELEACIQQNKYLNAEKDGRIEKNEDLKSVGKWRKSRPLRYSTQPEVDEFKKIENAIDSFVLPIKGDTTYHKIKSLLNMVDVFRQFSQEVFHDSFPDLNNSQERLRLMSFFFQKLNKTNLTNFLKEFMQNSNLQNEISSKLQTSENMDLSIYEAHPNPEVENLKREFQNHMKKYNEDLTVKNNEIQNLNTEVQNLKFERDTLRNQLDHNVDKYEKKMDEMRTENNSMNIEFQNKISEASNLTIEKEKLLEENNNLLKENNQLKDENALNVENIHLYKEQISNLNADLKEMTKRKKTLVSKLKNLKKEISPPSVSGSKQNIGSMSKDRSNSSSSADEYFSTPQLPMQTNPVPKKLFPSESFKFSEPIVYKSSTFARNSDEQDDTSDTDQMDRNTESYYIKNETRDEVIARCISEKSALEKKYNECTEELRRYKKIEHDANYVFSNASLIKVNIDTLKHLFISFFNYHFLKFANIIQLDEDDKKTLMELKELLEELQNNPDIYSSILSKFIIKRIGSFSYVIDTENEEQLQGIETITEFLQFICRKTEQNIANIKVKEELEKLLDIEFGIFDATIIANIFQHLKNIFGTNELLKIKTTLENLEPVAYECFLIYGENNPGSRKSNFIIDLLQTYLNNYIKTPNPKKRRRDYPLSVLSVGKRKEMNKDEENYEYFYDELF